MAGSFLHAPISCQYQAGFPAMRGDTQQLGLFNVLLQNTVGMDTIRLQHEGLHASMVKIHIRIALQHPGAKSLIKVTAKQRAVPSSCKACTKATLPHQSINRAQNHQPQTSHNAAIDIS